MSHSCGVQKAFDLESVHSQRSVSVYGFTLGNRDAQVNIPFHMIRICRKRAEHKKVISGKKVAYFIKLTHGDNKIEEPRSRNNRIDLFRWNVPPSKLSDAILEGFTNRLSGDHCGFFLRYSLNKIP